MSILEWFVVGLIILIFLVTMICSMQDLIKDFFYYRLKRKNVKQMNKYKRDKKSK